MDQKLFLEGSKLQSTLDDYNRGPRVYRDDLRTSLPGRPNQFDTQPEREHFFLLSIQNVDPRVCLQVRLS